MTSLSDPARPLAHESMSQGVYRHLRERLIAGQFSPGERLTLDAVARALGTSHMPVREAIRRLAAERALEILPNCGGALIQQHQLGTVIQHSSNAQPLLLSRG